MIEDKFVDIKNLTKVFRTEEVETCAVNDVSFSIARGEYVAISGPSGGGKSTLLSLLGLLDYATQGSYCLNGVNTMDLNKSQLCALRNKEIGFIFQSFNLIESLSVLDNVVLPLIYRKEVSKADAERQAIEALRDVEMDHRKNHKPQQLSGGQQQRVAVARAMVTKPSIILADEPTGNLDSKNANIVMQLIKNLNKSGSTVCIVTHDPRYAEDASRIIHFADGSIISQ
jgi:putative ABC transport system ATP-binding protein